MIRYISMVTHPKSTSSKHQQIPAVFICGLCFENYLLRHRGGNRHAEMFVSMLDPITYRVNNYGGNKLHKYQCFSGGNAHKHSIWGSKDTAVIEQRLHQQGRSGGQGVEIGHTAWFQQNHTVDTVITSQQQDKQQSTTLRSEREGIVVDDGAAGDGWFTDIDAAARGERTTGHRRADWQIHQVILLFNDFCLLVSIGARRSARCINNNNNP